MKNTRQPQAKVLIPQEKIVETGIIVTSPRDVKAKCAQTDRPERKSRIALDFSVSGPSRPPVSLQPDAANHITNTQTRTGNIPVSLAMRTNTTENGGRQPSPGLCARWKRCIFYQRSCIQCSSKFHLFLI